jgi:hypothetical protein
MNKLAILCTFLASVSCSTPPAPNKNPIQTKDPALSVEREIEKACENQLTTGFYQNKNSRPVCSIVVHSTKQVDQDTIYALATWEGMNFVLDNGQLATQSGHGQGTRYFLIKPQNLNITERVLFNKRMMKDEPLEAWEPEAMRLLTSYKVTKKEKLMMEDQLVKKAARSFHLDETKYGCPGIAGKVVCDLPHSNY